MPLKFDDLDPLAPGSNVSIDRSRWKFDEDGFAKANDAALLQARAQLQERIKSIHQDIVDTWHANDFEVTLGGVPIDKAKIEKL